MKKIFSLIVAIICCTVLLIPTYAYDEVALEPIVSGNVLSHNAVEGEAVLVGTFQKNEYDMYIELQETPDSVLYESGYTDEDIEKIKSTTIEDLIYQRAQLPQDELLGMGYTQEEIQILKAYDGSPLSENPQLRRLFADLSGELYVVAYGHYRMTARFEWTWSSKPLLSGPLIMDTVACGFLAIDENNDICAVKYDEDWSECIVSYYNGNKNVGNPEQEILVRDINGHVESQFRMSGGDVIEPGWAKEGSFEVSITEVVTAKEMEWAKFVFVYGHTTLEVTPSIDISISYGGAMPSISVDFGIGTEEMFYKTLEINREGEYDIYSGS